MNYPSQRMERHNRPELEEPVDETTQFTCPKPLYIRRDAMQHTLVEPSVNCCRISVTVKQADEMERLLVRRLTAFLSRRAAPFGILRRQPLEGYDVTFLVTYLDSQIQKFSRDDSFSFRLNIQHCTAISQKLLSNSKRKWKEQSLNQFRFRKKQASASAQAAFVQVKSDRIYRRIHRLSKSRDQGA